MTKIGNQVPYTDVEVIERVLHGEIGLFEILIRRNNPYLYKIGRSYGHNHENTQDLMQDTFIDAYNHLSKFEQRSSFKTWIIKIMLNNCFRKKQKWSFKNEVSNEIGEKAISTLPSQQQTTTNRAIMNTELSAVIEDALEKLPLDYKMVFSLREVTGLSVIETGKALEISEANVKVRLYRAKEMLRKEIRKSYSAEDIFDFNLIYCDPMVERVMSKIQQKNN